MDAQADYTGDEVPLLPPQFRPSLEAPLPQYRCRQISSLTARRCTDRALPGAYLCLAHGGDLPQVREAATESIAIAKRKLAALAEPAVDVLARIMDDDAVPTQVRLKAATEVLDRAGVRGGIEIEAKHEISITSSRDRIIAQLDRLQEAADKKAELQAAVVVDAEVVDADDH